MCFWRTVCKLMKNIKSAIFTTENKEKGEGGPKTPINVITQGAVHKRRRQLGRGEGSK
jgi:hypothetical protein